MALVTDSSRLERAAGIHLDLGLAERIYSEREELENDPKTE